MAGTEPSPDAVLGFVSQIDTKSQAVQLPPQLCKQLHLGDEARP